jgi:trimeric autotransporter adhesin
MHARNLVALAVAGAGLGWGMTGATAPVAITGSENGAGHFAQDAAPVSSGGIARGSIPLKDGPGSGTNSWLGNDTGGNIASGTDSAVTAGRFNQATNQSAFVGAGKSNRATGISSLVIGGFDNRATAIDSLVASGAGNRANGARSVVIGGGYNMAAGQWSFVGGGGRDGLESTPAGTDARDNIVSGNFGTLVGGQGNTVENDYGFVGGGHRNYAFGANGPSTVGGGGCNQAIGDGSTVAGGGQFSATAACTFGNLAQGASSTVGGGFANKALGSTAVIGGGRDNMASGARSVIPGGELNVASGENSFAAGFRARTQTADVVPVVHSGTFVWSDGNAFDFNSTASNQYNVRSTGGVRIVTGINGGTGAPTTGVTLDAGGGAWNTLSDRAVKENWRDVDAREVLERVVALPIGEWNYIAQGADVRHVGPAAQDFHAAFGLGSSERTISTVDADGVALAAIQGLKQLVDEKEAKIGKLEKELALIKAKLGIK